MSKRPSNLLLNIVIAIAAVFGLFVLGSWLLQAQSDTEEGSAGKSTQISEASLRPRC